MTLVSGATTTSMYDPGCVGPITEPVSPYNVAMRYALRPHPNSLSTAGTTVKAEFNRQRSGLSFRYFVTGRDLLFPPLAASRRGDELWKHTCFEAFLRPTSGGVYYEFNFAPSTQWAIYRFAGYRAGMSVVQEIEPPDLKIQSTEGRFELQAMVRLDGLPDLPFSTSWKIGLTAIIEDSTGYLSYWALVHPAGKPDFHDANCFSLECPAT